MSDIYTHNIHKITSVIQYLPDTDSWMRTLTIYSKDYPGFEIQLYGNTKDDLKIYDEGIK